MKLLSIYYDIKKLNTYLFIISGNLLLLWLFQYFLINEIVFYNTYSEQLTYERSLALFERLKSLSWIGYVFVPVELTIKFFLVSVVLYAGIFLCNLHQKINFSKIFGVVIASEVVYLIAGIIKLFRFMFFADNYDLNDLQFYFPLSLAGLFSWSEVEKFWVPALQSLNLFQIGYILLLSTGIRIKSGIPGNSAEKAVMISYLPGLIFWIALIMFLSVDKAM
jgi:hypothetical protein